MSLYATFPVVFNLSTCFYGYPGDNLVWLWHLWWLKFSWLKGIPSDFVTVFAYPYGLSTPPLSLLWQSFNLGAAILFGDVVTYNIQIILSFILSGVAMYYLVFRFVKNRYSAFFAGTAFAFCPYHFARSWDHLSLANIHWMVFYILALFALVKNRTYRMAIIGGICFGLIGHLSNFYYVYFMILFSVLFFGFFSLDSFFRNKRVEGKSIFKMLRLVIVMAFVAGLMIIPQVNGYIKNMIRPQEPTKAVIRPFNQLFADSAKPLNYFLPAEYNPLIGKITKSLVGTIIYGDNTGGEQSLFLGFIPLLLCYLALKRKKKNPQEFREKTEANFAFRFFVLSGVVFMITSFSPFWGVSGGLFIPFPSFVLFKIFPMFRNYARLGVLVMISVCVIAGFGMKYVLESIKNNKKRIFVFSLLMLLLFIEFLNFPPFRIVDTTKIPEVYKWLKNEPEDKVIVEYPLEADNRWNLYYQRIHQKRMVNYTVPGTYANQVSGKILDLEAKTTPGILKFLGVDYLIVNNDKYLNYEGGPVLGLVPKVLHDFGYNLVKDFGAIKVYTISAEPIDPKNIELEEKTEKEINKVDLSHAANSEFPFKVGDGFKYSIKYFGIIPVIDFNLTINRNSQIKNNKVNIIAEMKAKGALSLLANSRADINSVFNTEYLFSEQYDEAYNMGDKSKSKHAVFDHQRQIMQTTDREVEIEIDTQDPLSSIFYLSCQKFKQSKKIFLNINPGKSNYKLEGTVSGIYSIYVANKQRKAWKIEADIVELKNLANKLAKIDMWFDAEDKRQKLLKIKTSTKVGNFTVEYVGDLNKSAESQDK